MRAFALFMIGWLAAGPAAAAVFKVGNTSQDGCDFESIQDAIDAAQANGADTDTIRIANSATYANQALVIGDQSLVIEGGFSSCATGSAATAADVSGNGTDTVIRIAPTESAARQVTLRGLHVHDGGTFGVFGTSGGGVYLTYNVTLTIENTVIDNNAAASGGGIYSDGQFGAPVVVLKPGTRIANNHAQYYGGGVYLDGGRLDIVADQVLIDGNQADTVGGGIAAINGAVKVGNPGSAPARYDVAGATVSHNVAGATGGGIYVAGPGGALDAHELIIDANSAATAGGGLAAAQQAQVSMQRDYAAGPAYQCPNWRECSRISSNSVGSASAHVGGAIALYSGAVASIAQTIVRGNLAQDGSVAFVDGSTLFLEGMLATANQSYDVPGQSGVMIRTRYLQDAITATVRIAYSTFAGNLEQAAPDQNIKAIDVIAQQYTALSIYSSAFYDAYYPVVGYSPYTDDCAVEGNGGSEYYGSHTRFDPSAGPGFNDEAAGDFRLRSESPLTDYCDASKFVASFRDLALTPRCLDDARKADAYGKCDVGAYESDHIFGNGAQ
jgi:hypothetical protein